MPLNSYEELQTNLKSNPKTWLVTGAAGFIGSNLVEKLLHLDQEVIGLDNLSTGYRENFASIANLVSEEQYKRFEFVEADIRNPEICEAACKEVDYVLHQAALGSVPRSIKDPLTTHASNASGFLNMLTAAKDARVKGFVYASSSSVYGDHPNLPKRESEVGNVLSPYAATKKFGEIYAEVFAKVYDFRTVGLRYFNVFGRRQDPNGAYAAVIPKWVAAMLREEDVFINGDGETSRDFCYIDNVVQANLLAATSKAESRNKVYNVAFGNRTTLNELFAAIASGIKKEIPDLQIQSPKYRDFREGDVRHSLADISQAKNLLGYDPAYDIQEGLKLALDFYISNVQTKINTATATTQD